MSIRRRVERLSGRLPAERPAGVPTDPAALLEGLLAGTVALDDFDRADADQVSAVAVTAG